MHRPRTERFDHRRQGSCGSRHVDARVGRAFGETQFAHAERKHRGERPVEVELSFVDFSEMDEQLCLEPARLAEQLARTGDEVRIAEYFDRCL